jgi:hypothetical protein
MSQYKSIKLKAAFLLSVFALNTVVAFACSMGLNMGYNEKHHDDKQEERSASSNSHTHAPGTKPHHHNSPAVNPHGGTAEHAHAGTGSHSHDTAPASHHQDQSNSEQDDCFQKEDKKLQQSQNLTFKAPVFVAFLSAFYGLEIAPTEIIATTSKFIIPQYYPPPDIRIAIQSFQI